MSAKGTTKPGAAVERPNLVELIDFVDLESEYVLSLVGMVESIQELMIHADDYEIGSLMCPGLILVCRDVQNRVKAIKTKADTIYKAYKGETVADETGGER